MKITVYLVFTALSLASFNVLADKCGADCGNVTVVEKYKKEGKGSGLGAIGGAVAGGLLGNQVGKGKGKTVATVGGAAGGAYVGHQVEKSVRTENRIKVSVRMDNGKTQTFDLDEKSAFAAGDRVQVRNGQPVRYTRK